MQRFRTQCRFLRCKDHRSYRNSDVESPFERSSFEISIRGKETILLPVSLVKLLEHRTCAEESEQHKIVSFEGAAEIGLDKLQASEPCESRI